ncbi:MAG: DUF4179 domain-containing protein [Romboutsia sp.]|uniref:DUF4179 domain-containing protein n=1 Tax=Romboutsia sp. TaxID=1965302 RepID=UPI003F2DA29E
MKDWLELLNDANVDLSEYKEKEINDIDKAKLKNSLRRKVLKSKTNNMKKIAVASMAIISLITITNSKVIADKFEKLISKNPIENFTNYEEIIGANYRNIVDQTVTNNGVSITINEVIFDYKEILISYTVSGENIDAKSITLYPKIFINGEEIKRGGISGTYSDNDDQLHQFSFEPREHISKVGEFDMKIVIGGKYDFEQDKIIEEGKWEFDFKVSNVAINESTQIFDIDKKINLSNGSSIYVSKVTITPVSTTVEFEVENIPEEELAKSLSIGCIIEDSKGKILKQISSRGISYNYLDKKGTAVSKFRNVSENAENISIIPTILFDLYYDEKNIYNQELQQNKIEIDIN